eukprot:TRINITY_DN94593_c0_g1_i1.p1 TRINITY_DN94593_c0_g1~~TRINITY_DN94593_c0_g1_i1.p1  ORF type:complete len:322 (+),score=75.90 TRINITY_DN94593_c0_g1_i1:80-1045(+)
MASFSLAYLLLWLCADLRLAFKFLNPTGCGCKVTSSSVLSKPPEAVEDRGQELPPCFEEHQVDGSSFTEPATFAATMKNCFPEEGFASASEADRLACLAPSGEVGTKKVPAFYLIGDSHSVSLRSTVQMSTSMSVFSAAWWGGRPVEILDTLQKVVQKGDVVGYSLLWDKRIPEVFQEDIKMLADLLASKGAFLIVFEDNPKLKGHAGVCYMTKAKLHTSPSGCSITWAEVHAQHEPYAAAVKKLQETHKNVYYFDWAPNVLCDSKTGLCDYEVPGTKSPAYRDSDHLSSDGAQFLSPFLCSFMKDHGLHAGGLHMNVTLP